MKKFHPFTTLFLFITIAGCGGDTSPFPVEKKFWTPEDYQAANYELTSLKYNHKELPNFDNPKTTGIIQKITDTNNVSVVANDLQLGINHRSEFTSNMFDQYRDLVSSYSGIDRSDKYEYPVEFVEILKFGLSLQLYYIKTGNENILKGADDPNAYQITSLTKRNETVLISNFNLYLDYVNYEDRFNDKALTRYSEGLKEFFPRLINEVVPASDFSGMEIKVDNMLKKSKNELIIAQLQNIQNLIKNKKTQPPS